MTQCNGILIVRSEGDFIKKGMSFVIPTLRCSPGLKNVLESFSYFSIPCDFEVLVVANLEDSNIEELVQDYSFARYLCSGVLGVNHARNLGIQHAKYEFIYFFDDDCWVKDPDFFVLLYKELQSFENKKCFVGGPYQLSPTANVFDQAYFQIQKRWLASGLLDSDNRCVFLLGGNFGGFTLEMRKHLLDPQIIFGGSETEFFLRLHRIGYNCYFRPRLAVQHQTSMGLMSLISKAYKQGRGAAYIRAKSLGFQSHYLRVEEQPPKQSQVRYGMSFYYFLFRMSFFWNLPRNLKWQLMGSRLKNWLMAPELARKNLMSRFVALVGIHLNSKK